MPKFKTTIMLAEDMNATGINVPEAVVEQLGAGRKPKVSVTLKGYTYRTKDLLASRLQRRRKRACR
jgi:hypothetical protein